MAKPTEYPDYATDANYTVGPDTGQPTKVPFTTPEVAQGNIEGPGYAPSPQKFNWWMGLVGDWVRYLGDEAAFAGPASATDNAVARFDGVTGKLLQNGPVTIGDTGVISGLAAPSAGTDATHKTYVDDAITAAFVPPGSDTHIIFNDGGSAYGTDPNFTFEKVNNELFVGGPGRITLIGYLTATQYLQAAGDLRAWNTTAATAGVPQNSPSLHLKGEVWDGAASETQDWYVQGVMEETGDTSWLTFYQNDGGLGQNPIFAMNGGSQIVELRAQSTSSATGYRVVRVDDGDGVNMSFGHTTEVNDLWVYSSSQVAASVGGSTKLSIGTSSVTLIPNGSTQLSLAKAAGDYLALGAIPSTTGALRVATNSGLYARNVANSADYPIARVDSSGNMIYSSAGVEGNVYFDNKSAGAFYYRQNGVVLATFSSGGISLGATSFSFTSTVTSPKITQAAVADAAGQTLTVQAQGNNSASQAGHIRLVAGANAGAGLDGYVQIRNPDNTSNYAEFGNSVPVRLGSQTVAGNMILDVVSTSYAYQFRFAGTSRLDVGSDGLTFGSAVTPVIGQTAVADVAGKTLTVQAQNNNSDSFKAGNLYLSGGDNAGIFGGGHVIVNTQLEIANSGGLGSLVFSTGTVAPFIRQEADGDAGGDQLSIHAQSNNSTTFKAGTLVMGGGTNGGSGEDGDVQVTGHDLTLSGVGLVDLVTLEGIALRYSTNTVIEIGNNTLGLFGVTPVAQPSSTGETTGFTAGTGTGVNDDSTFTGGVGTKAYRISDVVKHLKNIGALAAS